MKRFVIFLLILTGFGLFLRAAVFTSSADSESRESTLVIPLAILFLSGLVWLITDAVHHFKDEIKTVVNLKTRYFLGMFSFVISVVLTGMFFYFTTEFNPHFYFGWTEYVAWNIIIYLLGYYFLTWWRAGFPDPEPEVKNSPKNKGQKINLTAKSQ